MDELQQNIKGATLTEFSTVYPTSPIRPQEQWISSRSLVLTVACRQRVRRRTHIPQTPNNKEPRGRSRALDLEYKKFSQGQGDAMQYNMVHAHAMRSYLPPPKSSVNETVASTTTVRRVRGYYG
ncbi:hypothetical protein T265_07293 [Opisthorchis viverrini]|uniref:Uncharacterized protein n=1 Tax=Opisthorchis viverrini TaxID=6198 RepID=A0A075AC01_OPIVI|nr:hypothetical protein T265_07293 [Opisthorchis viverrini]KER25189.1 hypothetical protein T265_07293 [Opisthorchis viverrini]